MNQNILQFDHNYKVDHRYMIAHWTPGVMSEVSSCCSVTICLDSGIPDLPHK